MLDDKYRIEHLLAVGGMGAVYVGTHIKLRKRVAIKVLNAELSTPAFIERFHREAITASQIGHEGIAQVTDIGTSTEGEPFLVMEYLEGESLATRLKASGPLPIDIACELGCSILSPLEAAHRAGIVHRDLKPDNVFLARQSRGEVIKLLDFGISRSQGQEGEFRLTTTGLVLGTPYYMSPEQARGDTQIGPAADLYAFGVIMYELLIGSVPIQGDNYNQLMYRVMTGDYTRPREKRPEIPEGLQQLILQTMSLEPARRPASAAELEQQLLAFCSPTFRQHTIERISAQGLPYKQSSPALAAAATGTDRTVLATPAGSRATAPTTKPRSRGLVVALGLVVTAGIGITVAVLATGGDKAKAAKGGAPTATVDDHPGAEPGPAGPPPSQPPPSQPPPSQPPPSQPPPSQPQAPPAQLPAVPVAGAPPRDPAAKDPAPKDPPAPEMINLQFSIGPAFARPRIKIDGKLIEGVEASVPKDAATHEVVITAPGFEPHTAKVAFDMSQRISVELPKRINRGGSNRPAGKDPKTNRIDTQSPYK